MHRCLPQSAASTGWIRSRRSTSSIKPRPNALDISSLEFYPLLCSSIYSLVAVHISYNGCRRSKTKPSSVNKLIICRCQQTSSVAVNKLFNSRRSLNQSNSNKPSLQNGLTRPTNISKEIIYQLCILFCVLFVVLCIVCCVS